MLQAKLQSVQDQLVGTQSLARGGELGIEVSPLSAELGSARLEMDSKEREKGRLQVVVASAHAWAPDTTPKETCSGFRLLMEPQAENRWLCDELMILRQRLEDLERRCSS